MKIKHIALYGLLTCFMLTGCTIASPPECLPGTQKCESNPLYRTGILYICQQSGEWVPMQSCSECQDNVCVTQGIDRGCDTEGEIRCEDFGTVSIQFECIQKHLLPTMCGANIKCEDNHCGKFESTCVNGSSVCYWVPELKLAVMSVCKDDQSQTMYCEKGIGCDGRVCAMSSVECPNPGEILGEATNTCICDTSRYWTGTSGHCECKPGYLNIDDNCEEAVVCDNPGEIRDDATNTCKCDDNAHWTGVPGNCECESGYLNINGSCVEAVVCDNPGEIRDDATNTCTCDVAGHWTGTVGSCVCETDYHKTNTNQCVKCQKNETWNARFSYCEYNCQMLTKDVQVGDVIEFGRYRQLSDSKEQQPIQWDVMAVDSSKGVLLISKFVLEIKKYNETDANVTWEKCTLRSWLNGLDASSNISGIDYSDNNFIKIAFTNSESKCIQTVTNDNPDYKVNGIIPGGNSTQDKVFCLRRDEVGKDSTDGYYQNDAGRIAYATAYLSTSTLNVNKEICYANDCTGKQYSARWWLRSPGWYQNYASYVTPTGVVYYLGLIATDTETGVRPVMWVKK